QRTLHSFPTRRSSDLQFEATWSEEQIKSHFAARDAIDSIIPAAFQEIGRRARNGVTTEHEMQQWFMQAFQRENLVTDDPPIVARSEEHTSELQSRSDL